MKLAAQIVIAVLAVACVVWLLLGSRKSSAGDAALDPSDPRQIGMLTGMMGGSVEDAAVAQSALRRFEQEHGRKATQKDAAIVVGMMRSGR